MVTLEVDGISKSFPNADGGFDEVLSDVRFTAESGTFTSLIGPSGCGKTTLLNIVADLLEPDSGVLKGNDLPVTGDNLDCSYVFQEPRLLEWATVSKNISFALDAWGVPEEEHDERIDTYLSKVGLDGEQDSYPLNLSGGMQQRVGIARALAVESDIILMDEPFSSLDEITAQQLRDDLLSIWRGTGKTVLFVTHNIREAIYMSDKILLMLPGEDIAHRRTVELARPRDMKDERLLRQESELMELMGAIQ
jgi:NitT/TauT family transport system ATP-binding protein